MDISSGNFFCTNCKSLRDGCQWYCFKCEDNLCSDCVVTPAPGIHILCPSIQVSNLPNCLVPKHAGMDISIHTNKCSGCEKGNIGRWRCEATSLDLCDQCLLTVKGWNIFHFNEIYQKIDIIPDVDRYEEIGYSCDICGNDPLFGPKWKCLDCSDFDCCWNCSLDVTLLRTRHTASHRLVILEKIILVRSSCLHVKPHRGSPDTGSESAVVLKTTLPDHPDPLSRKLLGLVEKVIPPAFINLKVCDEVLLKLLSISLEELSPPCKTIYQFAISVYDVLSIRYPDEKVSIEIATQIFSSLLCPFSEEYIAESSSDRTQFVEKEKFLWLSLLEEFSQVPKWMMDQNIIDGFDYSALTLLVWVLSYDYRLLGKIENPGIVIPVKREAKLQLAMAKICEKPVSVIPLADLLRFTYLHLEIPAYQDCSHFGEVPSDSIIVFVSHRWKAKNHPDLSGDDWKELSYILKTTLVEGCKASWLFLKLFPLDPLEVLTRLLHLSSIGHSELPKRQYKDYEISVTVNSGLILAIIRAAFDIICSWTIAPPSFATDSETVHSLVQAVSKKLFIWYDFTCIPQSSREITPDQQQLLKETLQYLGNIQRSMYTMVVNDAMDYVDRAWCVAEWSNSESLGRTLAFDFDSSLEDNETSPFPASFSISKRILRTMLNPNYSSSSMILHELKLNITNGKTDSDSVCRMLWNAVTDQFLNDMFHWYDLSWSSLTSMDFSSKSIFKNYLKEQHRMTIAIASTMEFLLEQLDFLSRMPNCSYQEWKDIRQREQIKASTTFDESKYTRTIWINMISSRTKGPVDSIADLKKDIKRLQNFCQSIEIPAGGYSIGICFIRDFNAAILTNPYCLILGYNLPSPLLSLCSFIFICPDILPREASSNFTIKLNVLTPDHPYAAIIQMKQHKEELQVYVTFLLKPFHLLQMISSNDRETAKRILRNPVMEKQFEFFELMMKNIIHSFSIQAEETIPSLNLRVVVENLQSGNSYGIELENNSVLQYLGNIIIKEFGMNEQLPEKLSSEILQDVFLRMQLIIVDTNIRNHSVYALLHDLCQNYSHYCQFLEAASNDEENK